MYLQETPLLYFKNLQICFSEQAQERKIIYPDSAFHAHEVVAIVAKSGAGKSTFLRILNGTLAPSKGEIFYCGQSFFTLDSVQLRREILLLAQKPFLFHDCIENNFIFFHQKRQLLPPTQESIQNFLTLTKMQISLQEQTSRLSGGELQKVFLAIALSLKPKVLLLDEPTSALDEQSATELFKSLLHYCKQQQMTLIFVSHSPLLQSFAERKIFLGENNASFQ